jgi:hypothetical protein
VRQALQHYRQVKQTLEALSELNQQLPRIDREESKGQERSAGSPSAGSSAALPMASSPKR